MNAGLEVINDSGLVQIDGNFFNYTLKEKTSISTVANPLVINGSAITVTFTDQSPIVAIPITNRPFGMISRQVSGGVTAMTFAFRGTPAGTPVDVYVYEQPVHVGKYGLEVRNETGEVVFSSESKYLKILGQWSIPQGFTGVSQPVTFPLNAERDIAIVISKFAGNVNSSMADRPPNLTWYTERYVATWTRPARGTGQLAVGRYFERFTPGGGATFDLDMWSCQILLVDVTGI